MALGVALASVWLPALAASRDVADWWRPASAGRTPSQVARERPAGLSIDFGAVRDDGTPISDLQPGEVEVRISGRLRPVRSLRRVAAAAPPVAMDARVIPAPFGTNDSVATGRSFLLVVDEESLLPGQTPLIRKAVDGLLDSFVPGDQAAVAALPFGGTKTSLTSDKARIRLAVAAVPGRGTRNETGSDLACRTRRFLEALDPYLRPHAGRPLPMTVVVFTGGLAAPRRDAAMAKAPGMCELLVDHFHRITVAAGAARANFFVVQPDDLSAATQRWRESISGSGYLGSDNPLEGVENLAGVTGGARLPLDATGTQALLRVARESSAYFVAEIDRERDDATDRSRTLDVRVRRRDVTVRARPEIAFSEPPSSARPTRLALPDLLTSREALTDLRLRVAGFTVREPDGKLRVGVVVDTAGGETILSSAGAALFDGDTLVARWAAGDTEGRPLLGAMPAAAGRYRLRAVAIDTTGRIGAAEETLEVGLTPVGPLTLGSLLLSVSRNDVLVPQLQFSAEPTAIASFDIYDGDAGMKLSAAVEVARDVDGAALLTLPLALARAADGRVVARGAIPIGALKPGDYVVRGAIRLEDGTTGRVIRTLRKTAG